MRRFVKIRCGSRDHKREIDNEGRIILGHIGNQEPIYRTLRMRMRGSNEDEIKDDIKKRISRLIDLSEPVDSVEFIEEEG
jgi:hypothetical protein